MALEKKPLVLPPEESREAMTLTGKPFVRADTAFEGEEEETEREVAAFEDEEEGAGEVSSEGVMRVTPTYNLQRSETRTPASVRSPARREMASQTLCPDSRRKELRAVAETISWSGTGART
jgi:hypothetical protein